MNRNYKIASVAIIIVVIIIILVLYYARNSASRCDIQPPSNLQAHLHNNKVTLSWNDVEAISNYCIYYGGEDLSLSNYDGKINGASNPITWEIPEPGTYYFVVTSKRLNCKTNGATCSDCESIASNKVHITYSCPKVHMPKVYPESTIEDNVIFLVWEPMENITKYTLYLKEHGEATSDNYDEKIDVKSNAWWYTYEIPKHKSQNWSYLLTAWNDCGESTVSRQ